MACVVTGVTLKFPRIHISRARTISSRHLRAPAVLMAIAIPAALFVLGAQPFAVGLVPAPWDKLAHATVFALLACAIALASGLSGWRMLLAAVCGAALVGIGDEWHQVYLPGRNAGWDDLAADLAGSLLGVTLLAAARRMLTDRARRRAPT
jgi:uncharacterized protein YfiM (DUF2279 family)